MALVVDWYKLGFRFEVRLNALAILGIVAFMFAFIAVYVANAFGAPSLFRPPYFYEPGDYWSYLNAFFFTLVVSSLFFGASAPIALAIEGAKYGSYLSTGAMAPVDLVFVVPSLVASIAASTLGQGVVADYRNQGSLFDYWAVALLYLNVSLFLFILALLVRSSVGVTGTLL